MRFIRTLMFEGKLDVAALAERLGMRPQNLRNEFGRDFSSKVTQARLEAFCRIPIWSTPSEFAERCQMAEILGEDPLVIPIKTLRARLSTARISGRSAVSGRLEMARLLCAQARQQPTPAETLSGATAPSANPPTDPATTPTPPVPC